MAESKESKNNVKEEVKPSKSPWKVISEQVVDDENHETMLAMEIKGKGCFVRISTLVEEMPAEAITFVPGLTIEKISEEGKVVGRKLVPMK